MTLRNAILKIGLKVMGALFCAGTLFSQTLRVDDFSSADQWQIIASEGVQLRIAVEPGYSGQCLRIDFDFRNGAGYGGVRKSFPLILPDHYRFQFFIRGQGPSNNLEFKLTDEKNENVWWCNQRNFTFPLRWQKQVIKKRHISFAWGPAADHELKSFAHIEFIIAASSGGQGTIWLDELTLQTLPPPPAKLPQPTISLDSLSGPFQPLSALTDGDPTTIWHSLPHCQRQQLFFDFRQPCEIGGLIIDWQDDAFARHYALWASLDGAQWDKVFSATNSLAHRSYLPLPELETRYLKLDLSGSASGRGFGIREIILKEVSFSERPESAFNAMAAENKRGCYPRYFLQEQIYWTVVGAAEDEKEALINENGAIEIDKRGFTLEPFFAIGDSLYTWADVRSEHRLIDGYLPIPEVQWHSDAFTLRIMAFASGPAGASRLWIRYTITNPRAQMVTAKFYLAIRPFQVNPPWQFLNGPGGISPIRSIRRQEAAIVVNETKKIYPLRPGFEFTAISFAQGGLVELMRADRLPAQSAIEDSLQLASALLVWELQIPAQSSDTVEVLVPFYDEPVQPALHPTIELEKELNRVSQRWREKLNRVQFDVPVAAQKVIDVLRSNLAYILINRDGPGIQPGSRSYERSWIRDGSLTSAALLRFGLAEEARAFLDWYAAHLFPSGKVPCVVDRRGPDPVPEHDSNGEFIFAFWQYYLFTRDAEFVEQHFQQIKNAVAYLDELVAQRSGDDYRLGDDSLRCFYGLVPESISHEGYSAKPMHSYWDNFFTLLGYENAVRLARVLHKKWEEKAFSHSRDRFRENLYRSLANVFRYKKIDFIPGCVELGDFDATSTAIAVFPCEQWQNLPQPQAQNTFDRYYQFFLRRQTGQIDWRDFTPYEGRLIGAFVRIGQPQRAYDLLQFFLQCQRPSGWNHWAEVVWKELRAPRFIGDMPHTWVGSDFINSVRAMMAYEEETSQTLIVAAGLPDQWLESDQGFGVKHLLTYWGALDFTIKKKGEAYWLYFSGDLQVPKGGILFPHRGERRPAAVRVDGKSWPHVDDRGVHLNRIPALVEIQY